MSGSINNCVLVGRLTKEVDLRQTTTGKYVAKFTLAVDRRMRRQGAQSVDFFQCEVWGAQAESCAKFLFKGSQVGCLGQIEIDEYVNKSGEKRKAAIMRCADVRFLSPKGFKGQDAEHYDDDGPAAGGGVFSNKKKVRPAAKRGGGGDGLDNDEDYDLDSDPF